MSETTFKKVLDLVLAGENICVRWLPRGGMSHFSHQLINKLAFTDYASEKEVAKVEFVLLDCENEFEDIMPEIEDQLDITVGEKNLRKAALILSRAGKKLYVIVDNFKFDPKIYQFLNRLRNTRFDTIRFIFLTRYSDFEEILKSEEDIVTIFLHNIVDTSYLNEEHSREWLNLIAKELDVEIGKKDIENIIEVCGGVPILLKNYIRAFKNYSDHKKTISSDSFKSILKGLWKNFSNKEALIIKQISLTGSVRSPYPNVFDYMKKHNLILDDNSMFGSWPELLLSDESREIEVLVLGTEFIWEDYNFTNRLTKKEYTILLELFNSDTYLTRERAAKILYPNYKDYSDWAIDKAVSRLRKKLEEIGIGGDKIQTLKGKGYLLRNLKIIKS